MTRYSMGIDCGTESVRAAVFDRRGQRLGTAESPNSVRHPAPGRAEQSLSALESSMEAAMRGALLDSGVEAAEIGGIGLDATTSTLVLLDGDGRPLRDAIMWMDVRAVEEAALITAAAAAAGCAAFRRAGPGRISPEWFPCKALWIKRNEGEIWEKARVAFELADWMAYRLTGRVTANANTAATRFLYDGRNGGYPEALFREAGLADLLGKLPGRVALLGEEAGGLLGPIASRTGLREGTPVAIGGGDCFVAAIGLDALAPGRIALITGSSHVHLASVDREMSVPGIFGAFPDAIVPGRWLLEGGQVSTGSVLRWFLDKLVPASITREAEARGVGLHDVLGEAAAALPPGSEGLLVLDHWQGNRTPWVDPGSRGVIRGLSLSHGPAHIYRAILEGVACGTATILGRLQDAGVRTDELVACGGATASPLWMGIHADIAGKPIRIPHERQAALLGSAALGAVVAGSWASVKEAAAGMAGDSTVIHPDPARHEAYRFLLSQYAATYEALKDLSGEAVARLGKP